MNEKQHGQIKKSIFHLQSLEPSLSAKEKETLQEAIELLQAALVKKQKHKPVNIHPWLPPHLYFASHPEETST